MKSLFILLGISSGCFSSQYLMSSRPNVRGASKKFEDFVNKIKSSDAIYLKLPYVCSQFNMNYRGKFQTNHLINVVVITIY